MAQHVGYRPNPGYAPNAGYGPNVGYGPKPSHGQPNGRPGAASPGQGRVQNGQGNNPAVTGRDRWQTGQPVTGRSVPIPTASTYLPLNPYLGLPIQTPPAVPSTPPSPMPFFGFPSLLPAPAPAPPAVPNPFYGFPIPAMPTAPATPSLPNPFYGFPYPTTPVVPVTPSLPNPFNGFPYPAMPAVPVTPSLPNPFYGFPYPATPVVPVTPSLPNPFYGSPIPVAPVVPAAPSATAGGSYAALVGQGFLGFKDVYAPSSASLTPGNGVVTLRTSHANLEAKRIKIYIPPGSKRLLVSFQTYRAPEEALVTARFKQVPTGSAADVRPETSISDSRQTLSRLVHGEELRFYSPASSGALTIANSEATDGIMTTEGGYIYLDLQQVPGGKILSLQTQVVVDEAAYRNWYPQAAWDAAGNPIG